MESAAELEARRKDAYCAIGRYVVEFSRLTFHMRTLMERRLSRREDSMVAMQLVFGDTTAAPLAHTFFALCTELGKLQGAEDKMRERLYDEVVNKRILERNEIVHGDWWVGATVIGPGRDPHAPGYTYAKTRKGHSTTTKQLPLDELWAKSDYIASLRNIVIEFGSVCFGAHPLQATAEPNLRVSDLFVIRDKQVRREGPKAGLQLLDKFSAELFANYF